MKIFWKYFFGLFILGILFIFYLLKTELGNQNLRYLLANYLSKETYNKIELISLDLKKYPYLVMELQVNDSAKVILKGEISQYTINMYYHLVGDSFHFNNFLLEDAVDIEGKLTGAFASLKVRGYGKAFDGVVIYNFINTPKEIKDMTIKMKNVSSQKLLKFLESKPLIKGSVDIDTNLSIFSKYNKKGSTTIHMDKAFIPQIAKDISFVVNSNIKFEGMDYKYEADMNSSIGRARLKNGEYCRGTQLDKGEYIIDFKDISYLKKELRGKYQGRLNLYGSFIYDNYSEQIVLKGETSQFGGNISYIYQNNDIDFKLKLVSLEKLLRKFSYPVLFSSNINGTISYNLEEKILLINTDLKDTHFKHTKLSDIIYDKLKIDILLGAYDKSYFSAAYQGSILSSTLKLDNGENYIYLTDTKISTLTNGINSKFEMKLQGQEIYGKIYGTLKDPKVWINKNKFFENETKRHLGSWLGTTK